MIIFSVVVPFTPAQPVLGRGAPVVHEKGEMAGRGRRKVFAGWGCLCAVGVGETAGMCLFFLRPGGRVKGKTRRLLVAISCNLCTKRQLSGVTVPYFLAVHSVLSGTAPRGCYTGLGAPAPGPAYLCMVTRIQWVF
jgi:hypothetical protein